MRRLQAHRGLRGCIAVRTGSTRASPPLPYLITVGHLEWRLAVQAQRCTGRAAPHTLSYKAHSSAAIIHPVHLLVSTSRCCAGRAVALSPDEISNDQRNRRPYGATIRRRPKVPDRGLVARASSLHTLYQSQMVCRARLPSIHPSIGRAAQPLVLTHGAHAPILCLGQAHKEGRRRRQVRHPLRSLPPQADQEV